MGESFGWSVSTCDLNGDGYDDLVVGAPTFAPNRFSYNSGRAHVFITDDWKRRYVCSTKSKQGNELTRSFEPTNEKADCWPATYSYNSIIRIK